MNTKQLFFFLFPLCTIPVQQYIIQWLTLGQSIKWGRYAKLSSHDHCPCIQCWVLVTRSVAGQLFSPCSVTIWGGLPSLNATLIISIKWFTKQWPMCSSSGQYNCTWLSILIGHHRQLYYSHSTRRIAYICKGFTLSLPMAVNYYQTGVAVSKGGYTKQSGAAEVEPARRKEPSN